MSQLLERENGLTMLRLRFGLSRGAGRASDRSTGPAASSKAIQLDLRGPWGSAALPSMRPEEIGLPHDIDGARRYQYGEPAFRLPTELLDALQAALASRSDPRAPLWLEFAQPTGLLALVPWERLLRPVVDVPMFRLPCFAVPAVSNVETLDLVICASSPVAKQPIDLAETVTELVRQAITAAGSTRVTLHVFADVAVRGGLERTLHRIAGSRGRHQVHVYDPRHAPVSLFATPRISDGGRSSSALRAAQALAPTPPEGGEGRRPPSQEISNPWLHWIMRELGDTGVDGVHFLAHGYLAIDGGMLALAESPTENRDTEWARFVAPKELAHFLTRVGAWYVGFSAPPVNFSPLGLRQLTELIARLHIGPVVLHEPRDPGDDALAHVLRFLTGATDYDGFAAAWGRTRTVPTMYFHPSRTGTVQHLEMANVAMAALSSNTLEGSAVGTALKQGGTVPAWMMAAQRSLERSAAELLETRASPGAPTAGTSVGDATRAGVESALRFISNVISANAAGGAGGSRGGAA